MAARVRWIPLVVGGELNGAIKQAMADASGVYAVRTKRGHGVVYVGESHVGHMWRTLLRHFQADRVRTDLPRFKRPEDYEVAWRVTSRGKRTKEHADERAMALQAEWIARYMPLPLRNVDDGLADDSFDFGANVEPEGAFDSVLNPAGALVELGRLTRLTVGAGVPAGAELAWNLRDAPILAYQAGRLFVVYVGKVVRPSSAAEVKEYKRSHWGAAAAGRVRDGGVAPAPFVDRGPAVSITYTTKKGADVAFVDYVHAFGEGARGRCIFPRVLEHRCRGGCRPTCAARGAIALQGGSYKVEARGIVG